MQLQSSLGPTYFIDSDAPSIIERARAIVGPEGSDVGRAVKLFCAVRDGLPYNPYRTTFERECYKASFILKQGDGFCVQKALVLAALSRATGVPCRLRFADVRNHLVTRRLRELMKTDVFTFHGYNEFYLEDRWVKATPAFNLSLCEKFGIHALDFNGRDDSILHPFDRQGNRHMEYLRDHGPFDDLPFEMMMEAFHRHYPHLAALIEKAETDTGKPLDFEREAGDENTP
jgi:transglutaminase-like putative cysteine protease